MNMHIPAPNVADDHAFIEATPASESAVFKVAAMGALLTDAELVALKAPFLEAWRYSLSLEREHHGDVSDEIDAIYDAAYHRCMDLADQIEAIPPTTLEGLKVHALVLSWCHSGEALEARQFCWGNVPPTDTRFLVKIASALINMEGGIDGSFKPEGPMSGRRLFPKSEPMLMAAE